MIAPAPGSPVDLRGLTAVTAHVTRAQAALSSIRVGHVAIGRDGSAFVLAIRDGDGLVLQARLVGYFRDKFAAALAREADADLPGSYVLWAALSSDLRAACACTAALFGVPYHQLIGPNRRALAGPRFAAAWVASQFRPDASLAQIAKYVGYADHSSMVHAMRQAAKRRRDDDLFRALTDQALSELHARPDAEGDTATPLAKHTTIELRAELARRGDPA